MAPEEKERQDRATEPEPEDLGYGPSHGNPPGHDGPTGPGDAPAKPAPSPRAK